MTNDVTPPRKEALSIFLTRQYRAAKLNPGSPLRRYLKGGLRVDMTYIILDNIETLRLQLHRTGKPPSLIEWKTILKYFGMDYQEPNSCFLTGSFTGDTLPKA